MNPIMFQSLVRALAGGGAMSAMANRAQQQQQLQQQQFPPTLPSMPSQSPQNPGSDAILRALSGDMEPNFGILTDDEKRALVQNGESGDSEYTDDDGAFIPPTIPEIVRRHRERHFAGADGRLRAQKMNSDWARKFLGDNNGNSGNTGVSPFTAENRRGSVLRLRY